jgi:Pectate lyase superfamily protein
VAFVATLLAVLLAAPTFGVLIPRIQNYQDACPAVAGPASNNGCPESEPPLTRYDVRDFGATPNDASNDTAAFESAMARAAQAGAAYVPMGTYRIWGMEPPNNARLQVQAGAILNKHGTANGMLINVQGPTDTTYAQNIHIEGVGGNFTIDLYDAGQETGAIRYRNVRGFSLRNMVCIQNNDNPTQEAPSSRKPCISFLPTTAGGDPIDGELENIHSVRSPYG